MTVASVRPPPRFLTDDEIIPFMSRHGAEYLYRIRVWRGKEATPIVLVTGERNPKTGEFMAPSLIRGKLANFVMGAILGFPESGMLYFDTRACPDGVEGGYSVKLTQVFFEFFGHSDRLRLFRPDDRITTWEFLETILDQKVEH